ncbi:MAG: AAA domain-containing protein [Candidatus Omnitrophica bacterium]|nr:AAA domain-containing protein [Candidatus Omnitrophota bacterium]
MVKDYQGIAERMAQLFRGREGVFAEQSFDSNYYPTNRSVSVEDYVAHLKGQITIAQYCLTKDDNVYFLIIDVDDKSLDAVSKVQASFKHFGFTSYVEDTGGRGYHVGMYFQDAVPAWKALCLGKLVVRHADLEVKVEVFPKQSSAAKLGNPIKLPLGQHRKYGGWSVFLDESFKPVEDVIGFLDAIKRYDEGSIDEILEVNPSDEGKVNAPVETAIEYNRDASEMGKIAEKCSFIKGVLEEAEQGKHIPYPTWRGLAGIYVNFGKAGEEFFHEISAKEPRSYVESECQKLLDEYKKVEHKPTSCDYFQCGCDPAKDCGLKKVGDHKQSPVRFGLVKQKSSRKNGDNYIAVPIHLTSIENPKYAYQKVKTDVMVAASGNTYQVPNYYKVYDRLSGQEVYRRIENTDPLLISLTKMTDSQMHSTLIKLNQNEFDEKSDLRVQIESYCSVEELVLVPRASFVRKQNDGTVVDAAGNDYREEIVYNAGVLSKTNGYFKAVGIVMPNPKNQKATMLVMEMLPIDSDVTAFRLSDTIRASFPKFQSTGNDLESINAKVSEILRDVTFNITEIYSPHRELGLFFVLLVAHSILHFKFNESEINRGWLDIIVIGDTGQGKSRMLEKFLMAIGLGQLVSGSATSRTGLAYNLDTVIDGQRVLKWGAMALNDGRMLVVDEFQKISSSQIEEISTARSAGLISVNRSVKGEHPARVRMIALANPVTGDPMRSFVYGILALRFQRVADIRRFDLAICVNKDDVNGTEYIYCLKKEREQVPQIIKPHELRNSVLRAWTRKPEDVQFDEDASDEIMEQAKVLTRKYETPEVPLVSTDTHEKLARFSVALATLLHSTDQEGGKVIVKKGHVQYISQKIQEVYDHRNCELNKLAAINNLQNDLHDSEYVEICNKINELIERETYKNATQKFLKLVLEKEFIRYADVSESLQIGEKAVRERMAMLVANNLVENTKHGYRKTRKGVLFLKKYIEQGGQKE